MQLPDNVPSELMQACYKGIADAACEDTADEIQAIWNTFVQYVNDLPRPPENLLLVEAKSHMRRFVQRVELGEVRSKQTYSDFKDFLERAK